MQLRPFLLVALVSFGTLGHAQDDPLKAESYILPPPEIARLVDAPRDENTLLTNLSPDGTRFLIAHSGGMPTIADMARPYVNLGGEMIDVAANRDRTLSARGTDSYELYEWRTGRTVPILAPKDAKVSGAAWSPDGKRVALFCHFDKATYVYVANAETGAVQRIGAEPVNAALVTRLQWAGNQRVATLLIPKGRGPVPTAPSVPKQPEVKVTQPGKNPTRTYRALLETDYDQELLEYLATAQLALLDAAGGRPQLVGKPAMINAFDPSPDGKYVRVTTMLKPFSYIVPVSSFGTVEEIWDATGKVLAEISKRPLRQGSAGGGGGPRGGAAASQKRALSWRPDGNGFSYLEQAPAPRSQDGGGDEQGRQGRGGAGAAPPEGADRKDRVMQWLPPFGKDDVKQIYENETRIGSVRYSEDMQTLFLTETRSGTETLFAVKLSEPGVKIPLSTDKADDFYDDPGDLLMKDNALGVSVVRQAPGGGVYLSGTEYAKDPEKDAPRPFLDAVPVGKGEKARVWQSSPDVYETIAAVLDDTLEHVVLTRQSPSMVPDSYLREASGSLKKLTDNRDFAPEVTQAPKTRFKVKRADGFEFWVTARVPKWHLGGVGLKSFFWFYPREYTDQKQYDEGGRRYNKNAFPAMGASTKDYLVVLGYAVIEPDCPIVGPEGRMNDLYALNLRMNLAATIDELERRGISDRTKLAIGGHSYGAFSTAHAMIQTPYFKAGIAGDGNYNRTLTPMAFQAEQRFLWDARETYTTMSPLLYAEQLTGALLMYHGMDDQNVGTDPINSDRMFQALEGLGKPAALYKYPYENHGPVARETLLDMWARWIAWLDKYVK
ncbi:MAG: prolyl oligopeptidase family serine peptidase [Fimbriimonadaceae bacterium]|nr:prolyl oligopeptidase family serine peptidase [Fimbriimonadaceae bacterium]